MQYKKFRHPTVRDALRAVREELGPQALVLSTRMVNAPGLRGWMGARVVEITAAIDRDEVSEPRIPASAPRRETPARAPRDAREVRARGVMARLQAGGLDEAFADAVAQHPALQERGADPQAMREAVADTLAPLVTGDEPAAIDVFIGPPGAGKTTTIAKIAAQARASRAERIGLVAADGFRVGAVEQLRLYAEIIGSPFAVARSAADLTRALDEEQRPLLVDTAGRSPRDTAAAEILEVLADRKGVRRHLVLPATTPATQARRMLERFAATRPDRLVLTRLDEADSLAPLVGLLRECRLPVSYLGHGQNVPDDLQRATPQALTDWVLGDRVEGVCA